MKKIYSVFGFHNRRGVWLAGVYDNEEAAKQHKAHLDATTDGWENFNGGTINSIEVWSDFDKVREPPTEQ